jgi:hypothetical protein
MTSLSDHLISMMNASISQRAKPTALAGERVQERSINSRRDQALRARKETCLMYYTVDNLATMFGDYEQGRSGRGIITKKDYNTVMRKVIQSKNTNITDPVYIEKLVEGWYDALYDVEHDCLNYHDILVGLGSMCKGSRDEKVEYIFSMLTKDARHNGLTLDNMIHYLNITYRVLYVTVPAIKEACAVTEIEMATITSEELFMSCSGVNKVVTFEEFKRWYSGTPAVFIQPEAVKAPPPPTQLEVEQAKYIKRLEKKLVDLERDYNKEWEDDSDNDSDYVPGQRC